jgi:hypothetical protein
MALARSPDALPRCATQMLYTPNTPDTDEADAVIAGTSSTSGTSGTSGTSVTSVKPPAPTPKALTAAVPTPKVPTAAVPPKTPIPTPPVPTNGEGRKEELARAAMKLRDELRRRVDEAKKSQATKDQALIAAAEAKVAQVQHELAELTRQAAFERERATQDVAAARDDCARQLTEARGAAELAEQGLHAARQTALTQSEEERRANQMATAAQGNLRNCEERERATTAAKETAEARARQLESDVVSANEAHDECRLRLNSAVQEADTAGRNFQEALRAALAGASENAAGLQEAAQHARDAQEELRACREEVQQKTAALVAAEETLRRVREESGDAERAAHTAAEETTTLRQELLEANDIVEQKVREMQDMEVRFESLRNALSDIEQRSAINESVQEDCEQRLVTLTAEKEEASNRCQARVAQANAKATEAEEARDAAQQRAGETRREKAALETRISELTAELKSKANAEQVIAQTKRERDAAIVRADEASARAGACDAAAERDISELKQELKEASVVLLWANQLDASHVDSMFGSTGTRLERYRHAADEMREKYETALRSVRADLKAKYRVVRGTECDEGAIRAMKPKQIAQLARKLHREVSPAETPSATAFLRESVESLEKKLPRREQQAQTWRQTTGSLVVCRLYGAASNVRVSCEYMPERGDPNVSFVHDKLNDYASDWGSLFWGVRARTIKIDVPAFGMLEEDRRLWPVIEIRNDAKGNGLLYALGFWYFLAGGRDSNVTAKKLRNELNALVRRQLNRSSEKAHLDVEKAKATTYSTEEEERYNAECEKAGGDRSFANTYQRGIFNADPALAKYSFVCAMDGANLGELEIDAFSRIYSIPVCVWSLSDGATKQIVYTSGDFVSPCQRVGDSPPILNFGRCIHLRRHESSNGGRGHYTLLALLHVE